MTSSTVDLSRLDAPAIVEPLDYQTIYAQMRARLQELLPDIFDALVDSDPAMKVLQVASYREVLLRQSVNDAGRQVMTAYATGAALDHLAALVGVARLVLTSANANTGAPAVMESDDALRRRIVLAPYSFSVAGPASAYVYHALSTSADVLDASATSPAPGDVLVCVLSRTGDGTASLALVAAVNSVLSADTVRPLTDRVTVRSAAIVAFVVTARLHVAIGPDASLVRDAAEAKLTAYLASIRKLGAAVTISGLYAALHVEGVQRVELTAPTADIEISATQAAWCSARTITAVAASG